MSRTFRLQTPNSGADSVDDVMLLTSRRMLYGAQFAALGAVPAGRAGGPAAVAAGVRAHPARAAGRAAGQVGAGDV